MVMVFAKIADQLQGRVAELALPLLDLTELAAGWGFYFNSPIAAVATNLDHGGTESTTPTVVDPSGALTILKQCKSKGANPLHPRRED
jgi:hypothetical protein